MTDLMRELQERGTAEVVNGEVLQVTQALDESQGRAKFILFGDLHECAIIPIDEACAKCASGAKRRHATVKECQERQAKDARARGFTSVICPEQFAEKQR
jgi:hypothetical protein